LQAIQYILFSGMALLDQGLHRLADRDILKKAKDEGRIVLTHDLDFGDLMAASGARLPSVIIFRLSNMSAANVNLYLDIILRQHEQALHEGVILSVTERRIRIRPLPIETT
jgi:predicted nuclease of predicted toxin-antitoxin system